MKIQILQGINFENSVTTIKIDLDADIKTTILEEIKKYHPVFLKHYEINKTSIIIQSKLPNLWKEIARVFNNLAIKKITEKEARKLILEGIIKKQINSMSTLSILDVADKLNEEISQFLVGKGILRRFGELRYNRQYLIGCGRKSTVTLSFSSCKDSQLARQIQGDKYLTNMLLDRLNMPSAPWEIVESEDHLEEIFNKYKKPVVLKPTSLTGGNGVYTGINTIAEAKKAYININEILNNFIKNQKRGKIMIQEQVEGEDYRLLIINSKLEAVTKRIPAFVIGDGESTVEELINQTNADPRRDIHNPTHILKPIKINAPLQQYLQEQNLNLSSVPPKGKKILLRKIASMSQGGITEDFTDKVHKQIKYLAESIATSLRVYVLGIDVICKDISKPLDAENGYIIEVNTMPEAYLNMFPVLGPQRPQIAQKFLEGLLGHLKPTQRVVMLGELELDKMAQKDCNTGIFTKKEIFINNESIKKNVKFNEAMPSLKLNSFLEKIVFHFQDIHEVEKYGFGFDIIDELHVQKRLLENKKLSSWIENINKNLIKKVVMY
jgi:D-alanine-D-alanine ligase-like ATP-grasp enzyme